MHVTLRRDTPRDLGYARSTRLSYDRAGRCEPPLSRWIWPSCASRCLTPLGAPLGLHIFLCAKFFFLLSNLMSSFGVPVFRFFALNCHNNAIIVKFLVKLGDDWFSVPLFLPVQSFFSLNPLFFLFEPGASPFCRGLCAPSFAYFFFFFFFVERCFFPY